MEREFTLLQPLPKLVFLTSLIAVAFGISIQSGAQAESTKELKDIEQSIDTATAKSKALARKAKENATDLKELRQRSISIAAKARDHTYNLTKLEQQLAELDQRSRLKNFLHLY